MKREARSANHKGSLFKWIIALGWGLLVIGGVSLVGKAFEWWQRQQEILVQSEEQLRRMKGWLAVEEEVRSRRDQVLGPFAHLSKNEVGWVGLQAFQQAAEQQGISVAELKPVETPIQRERGGEFRLDAKIQGRLDQISQFLQKLPDFIPGVHLEDLQLMPSEGDQIQGLLRLRMGGQGR